jgi:hypothetical protein
VERSESGSPDSDEPIPTSIVLDNTVLGTDNSARHVSLLCS